MKISIQGNEMTEKDLIEIGKFLTKFFEGRNDIINVSIEEGLGKMTKEKTIKMLASMFEDKEHYIKVFDNINK